MTPSQARNGPPGHGSRLAWVTIAAALALVPGVALAHGGEQPKPTAATLITGWEFDFFFVFSALVATWLYLAGVRRVNRLHPASPYPRKRTAYFLCGIGALAIAIMSPIATYSGMFFSVHMWQHMLIVFVGAPLVLLGTPLTLGLRAATPRLRKELLLPILHSRVVRVITFPVLAWLVFTVTMWATHFLPIYNEALENTWLHRIEHWWFMVAALLFWWQVIAVDPTPWRMNHPIRMLYLFLQMPQNSFLALAIYSSSTVIYEHYETVTRTWGPSALADQELAGITMWVFGDLAFIVALGFVAYGWVQHEERRAKIVDRQLARERAAARGA